MHSAPDNERIGITDSFKIFFKKALSINDDYAPANTNLGVLFLARNQCDSAIHYFYKAVNKDSTNWNYVRNLIGGLQQCGRNKELIRWLDYGIEHFKDVEENELMRKMRKQLAQNL